MLPGIAALGATQLNLLVDTLLALRLDSGSLTALRLGNRVTLLPLGGVAVAVATASLPALSRRAAARDSQALVDTLGHTIRLLLTLLVPAATALVILAEPIVALLFQYGRFTATESTPMTAAAVAFYALGLPAYGLARGLAQAFYSVQDTRTPVIAGVVSMLSNVALSLLLMGPLGLRGLALATSLAGVVNVAMLAPALRRKVGTLSAGSLAPAMLRIVAASAALAGGCILGVALGERLPGDGVPMRTARVALDVALGLGAMLAVYGITKHAEMLEVLGTLRRRPR
jgi:putative peptidoglycan lipid II flippase